MGIAANRMAPIYLKTRTLGNSKSLHSHKRTPAIGPWNDTESNQSES